MKYIIRDREAGNEIATFETLEEAQAELEEYEEQDRKDGTYTEDFYEIVEILDTAARIKSIRREAGLSQRAFAEKFGIPVRTVQNWEYSVNEAPEYLLNTIEQALVNENMRFVLLGMRGHEELVFSGDKIDCAKYADALRKECRKVDPDGTEIDCYIKSMSDIIHEHEVSVRWNELTEEEKKDIIEVNGRKYIRKIWEENRK